MSSNKGRLRIYPGPDTANGGHWLDPTDVGTVVDRGSPEKIIARYPIVSEGTEDEAGARVVVFVRSGPGPKIIDMSGSDREEFLAHLHSRNTTIKGTPVDMQYFQHESFYG